ncbi:ImmA/IrrE family metallo-endopeptidase [Deinococcus sp. MIMF12]|uniref:ImmA/IrrE family metallo-endopeptidase n=1 Tax=Deinococcus rhizophilus TaxID=3049544 RepID=A0ABT7JHZ1_9DEIO|nr:helix-turn-helix domain-containing protein [Deinococcus rhizophilus]MDL2344686.1 ImmA/IrrE family metallo-endopeptidase [Deinococcus rhizophilus]
MNVNFIGPLREQQGLSQTELGHKVGVTRQTIAVWEKGERLPSLGQISRIAAALGVSTDIFLKAPEDHTGPTLLFRADDASALTLPLRAQIQQKVLDYVELERDLKETPTLPPAYPLDEYDEAKVERIAREVRDFLGVEDAPLGDVISLLEDRGFKVIVTPLPRSVSGFSAYTEEWGGIIVVNASHPVERQYFTALHELAHLICHRKDYNGREVPAARDPREKIANHLAGATLLSREAMERELRGYQHKWIPDPVLINIKQRYSVSMRTILMRAKQLGMITGKQAGQQLGKIDKTYGKESEPAPLHRQSELFGDNLEIARDRLERLVYEAASKDFITRSRAAEILGVSPLTVRKMLGKWLEGTPGVDD